MKTFFLKYKLPLFLLIFTSPLQVLYFKMNCFNVDLFRIVFITTLLIFISLVITDKLKLKFDKGLFFLISLFMLFYTISWLRSDIFYAKYANFKLLSIFMFFAVIIMMCNYIKTKELLILSLKLYMFTCSIICIFNITNFLLIKYFSLNLLDYTDSGMSSYNFISESPGDAVRLSGSFFDTNVFGLFVLTSILLFIYFIYNTDIKHKNVLALMCWFQVANLFLTLSRSVISLFIMNILFILFFIIFKQKITFKFILSIFMICIFCIILFFNYEDQVLEIIDARLNSQTEEALRRDGLNVGLEHFLKNPVIGVGLYNYGNDLCNVRDRERVPTTHSLYIDILADTGFTGIISFLCIFLCIFYRTMKNYTCSKENIYIFFLLIIFNIFLFQIVYSVFFSPFIAVILGIITYTAIQPLTDTTDDKLY